ncbi:hypothetical protein PROFUN_10905 [Planoprotostelium fungivorum]|uniref:Uncharacterized protein n=1 Tax=Planoprotostelium fungivorum TaxID=1890364 RepID=A0A2P6NC89_9EUKA|nr:hypothetical protein PROFUN_10905 [Planoprotostelium fungivorum]
MEPCADVSLPRRCITPNKTCITPNKTCITPNKTDTYYQLISLVTRSTEARVDPPYLLPLCGCYVTLVTCHGDRRKDSMMLPENCQKTRNRREVWAITSAMVSYQEMLPLDTIMCWIDELWTALQENEGKTLTCPPATIEDFTLLHPMSAVQRRSYDNENRFLIPRPSQLAADITKCTVRVQLFDSQGSPLNVREQQYLKGPPDALEMEMDLHKCRSPPFCLKIHWMLGESRVMLGFIIEYSTKDGTAHQVTLRSNVFALGSGKKSYKTKKIYGNAETRNML